MKQFTTLALSALAIAVMIGVYVNQSPQSTQSERASAIEPAAGQQPASDAVEESIKRIEKTMQEMDKRNNAWQPQDQDTGNATATGDQNRSSMPEKPGIENLNAPREPTGDGMTEIIHAEGMTSEPKQDSETVADKVQAIKPTADDVEETQETVQDKGEQVRPDMSGNTETDVKTEKQQ